ncbi:MAG: hypothetical protein IKC22_05915 [Bacilli bacterium]|nr:hypothetical protein [Bacilli bacterium]
MLVVELNDLKVLDTLADGFLIGVEFISSECFKQYKLEQTIEIINKIHERGKLAFIDATQIFHDQDLEQVKNILTHLKDADYILYNDLALIDLIDLEKRFYYSVTYITNKQDFSIVEKENAYTLLSPTLSFEELVSFGELDKAFLIGFGTFEIFHSRRPLISNYMKYRNTEYELANYQVIEEFRSEKYPIVENNGTKIYLNDYYYLGKELEFLNKNIILKTFDLKVEDVFRIVSIYSKALKTKDFIVLEDLEKLPLKLHKGLLLENSILKKEVKARG